MEISNNVNTFEVQDMPGMNTVAYVVEKNSLEYEKGNPFLTLQKIDSSDTEENGKMKKVFSVLKTENENPLVVLVTLSNSKAILSTGELTSGGFLAKEKDIPLSYGTIYNEDAVKYKEVTYTPDFKRHFSIIDTSTGDEVKPTLYRDESTNTIKGRCKLLPNRPYVVLELNYKKTEE